MYADILRVRELFHTPELEPYPFLYYVAAVHKYFNKPTYLQERTSDYLKKLDGYIKTQLKEKLQWIIRTGIPGPRHINERGTYHDQNKWIVGDYSQPHNNL